MQFQAFRAKPFDLAETRLQSAQGKNALAQVAESKRQTDARNVLAERLQGGIPTDQAGRQEVVGLAASQSPEQAIKWQSFFGNMDDRQRQQAAADAPLIKGFLTGVQDDAGYQQARQQLAQYGIDDAPEVYNPGHVNMMLQGANFLSPDKDKPGFSLSAGQTRFDADGNQLASVAPEPETYTLSPGQQRVDAEGNVLASVPRTPGKPKYQTVAGVGLVKIEEGKDPEVMIPEGEAPDFKTAEKLRKEFIKESGDFIKVRDGINRVEAAAKDPSAAGDLALIFNYMKVLDPGSTVREGEFATAQNSGGVDDRVVAQYNSVVSGERLSETQRADFLGTARRLYDAQLQSHNQLRDVYDGLSSRFGVDPQNVTIDRRTPARTGDAPAGDSNADLTTMSDDDLAAEEQRLQARITALRAGQ